MWWKKHKWKLIVPGLIIVTLTAAFWYGGNAPGLQGWTVEGTKTAPSPTQSAAAPPADGLPNTPAATPGQPSGTPAPPPTPEVQSTPSPAPQSRPEGGLTAEEKVAAAALLAEDGASNVPSGDQAYSQSQGMDIDPTTGKDKYLTDPVPEGKPIPVEPQEATISDVSRTCTFSISCATILNNMDWLDPEKVELVPEDGWILEPVEVIFYEGENVFDVLRRTCMEQKIHMEFSNTPMYNSAYIEGIHNLYEFDCGELSGWMYKVNGWFPNYGCSRYALRDGDVVCWEYTCDLGVDVGGFYAVGE